MYDASAGVEGIVEYVKRDVQILVEAGFDSILFCNEGDRPYQFKAGLEGTAVLTRVVTECAPTDRPFGVDFLWDPQCALAVAVATSAAFIREVTTARGQQTPDDFFGSDGDCRQTLWPSS
jgi:predicted TIM-barrel enzyme